MMKSIFASKLYKASTRKDRIHAAIIAPSNLALVQQLADDLDEDYQTPENLGTAQSEPEQVNNPEGLEAFLLDEEVNPETDLVTMDDLGESSGNVKKSSSPKHHSSSSKAPKAPEGNDGPEPSAESKADTSNLMPESPANEKPAEPTEASTKVHFATAAYLTVLKNTLNEREDTAGVTRIAEKDNEVWIYYNDDVNLNNVMTEVIECLMNSGYESFEFNRLARSDNAIVFVVVRETSEIGNKEFEPEKQDEVLEDNNLEESES